MSYFSTLSLANRQRLSLAAVVLLTAGNLILGLAAIVWLWIPDSHVWQLLLSALLALLLLTGTLFCNAVALRRIRASQTTRLWMGALILGGWLLIAALLFHALGFAEVNLEERAGYWNAKMSPGLRVTFPYARLIALQQGAIDVLRCVLLPALLLPLALETTSRGLHAAPLRRVLRVWLAGRHWLIAIPAGLAAFWIAPKLTLWHPAHTVTGEALSAFLRLLLAGFLMLAALLAVLATDAGLLQDIEATKGVIDRS